MTILEKSSLHEEIHEVDHHENMVFLVDGILVDGASWSIDVDTCELAKLTALGALSAGTGETAIVGNEYSQKDKNEANTGQNRARD
ncbi:hypothetical protein Tco_0979694 [Tanacetum coccineum]